MYPRPHGTPEEFLEEVANAQAGWSDSYGGPRGVAFVSVQLQDTLKAHSRQIAEVRNAAIQSLLVHHSLGQVASMLGVSKQAISKTTQAPRWVNAIW